MKKISIIGGGFAGMTLAWHLAKRGLHVDLYEKSARLGGMISTLEGPYGMIETAANGMMLSEAVDELLSEIKADTVGTKAESKKRYIFRKQPRRWPLTIIESFSLFLKLSSRWFFHGGKKAFRPRPQESLQLWGHRCLTKSATEFLLAPALQGIYAGDVSQMSAPLILGRLFSETRSKPKKYRGLISGRQGMGDIVTALEKALRKAQVQIHLNSKLELNQLSEGPVVIASGLTATKDLLKSQHPKIFSLLAKIEIAPLVTVTAFWDKAPKNYLGFGILVPLRQGFKALGILRNSLIFPNRDKTFSETTIFGGPFHQDVVGFSDGQLVSQVCSERKALLQDDAVLLHAHVTRWPQGLPQYNLNLENILPQLQMPEGLYLHGNYLGGIGLTKILDRSVALASELAGKYG